jgi:hypothetical protein
MAYAAARPGQQERATLLVGTGLMQYGRIVRITYTLGRPYATYIVAEENAAKATATMKAQVGADASAECIGRASKELLRAVGLSAGESKKVDPDL